MDTLLIQAKSLTMVLKATAGVAVSQEELFEAEGVPSSLNHLVPGCRRTDPGRQLPGLPEMV